MPRIHFSAEARQAAVDLVLTSGIPVAQVAREVGCSVATLHAWTRKHRRSLDPPAVGQESPATFVPVKVIEAKLPSVEIVAPNGFIVRLADFSPQSLAELLTTVASC
jgi:transposase-like protein